MACTSRCYSFASFASLRSGRRCVWTSLRAGLYVCLFLCVCLSVRSSLCDAFLPVAAPTASVTYVSGQLIRQVAEGPDGTVWAATNGGVVCWRGNDFRRWAAGEGLPGGDVRGIAVAPEGTYAATACSIDLIRPNGSVIDLAQPGHGPPPEGEIRCIASATPSGCWVGSTAGLYHWDGAAWKRALDCQVWRLAPTPSGLMCVSEAGLRYIRGDTVTPPDRPLPGGGPSQTGAITDAASALGKPFLAAAFGFWRDTPGGWEPISLPPGSGASHVSALAGGQRLYAGLFGDGVYSFANGAWRRIPDQPQALARVTALQAVPGGLLAGVREDGAWMWNGRCWTAFPVRSCIPSADIYSLADYLGATWAATFDGGVLRMGPGGATAFTPRDGLLAPNPRGLLVFQGNLFVRYATGQVDRFDGKRWQQAFTHPALVRPEVYSFATDGARLYLGQSEGWSATDGRKWDHHLTDPDLQRQVVTCLAPQGDRLWIGTQRQGLFCWQNGRYSHFHEAQGLTDDWITCLAVRGDRLLVGTYTGGLLEMKHGRFTPVMKAGAYAIRAIDFVPGTGEAIVTTPVGVYREAPGGWQKLDPARYGGIENQSLLATPTGLWIGSRTALAFVRWDALGPGSAGVGK